MCLQWTHYNINEQCPFHSHQYPFQSARAAQNRRLHGGRAGALWSVSVAIGFHVSVRPSCEKDLAKLQPLLFTAALTLTDDTHVIAMSGGEWLPNNPNHGPCSTSHDPLRCVCHVTPQSSFSTCSLCGISPIPAWWPFLSPSEALGNHGVLKV